MFADEDLFDIVIRSDTAKKIQKGRTQGTQTNDEDLETEDKSTTTLTATVSQEVLFPIDARYKRTPRRFLPPVY